MTPDFTVAPEARQPGSPIANGAAPVVLVAYPLASHSVELHAGLPERLEQVQQTVAQELAALRALVQEQDIRLAAVTERAELLARSGEERAAAGRELLRQLAPAMERLRSWERHAVLAGKDTGYQRLVLRVRGTVRAAVPAGATVIVVSKGDEELVRFDDRQGWHFPRRDDGVYAGHYPAASAEAIAHLEALRAAGASHLLFPMTALWWLDHYQEFEEHLDRNYHATVRREDTCIIYALHGA